MLRRVSNENYSAIIPGSDYLHTILKGELLSPKKPIHTHDDLCAVAAAALFVAGAVSAVAVWSALAVRFIVVAETAKRGDGHGPSARAAVSTSAICTALAVHTSEKGIVYSSRLLTRVDILFLEAIIMVVGYTRGNPFWLQQPLEQPADATQDTPILC